MFAFVTKASPFFIIYHTAGITTNADVSTGTLPRSSHITARIINDATGVAFITERIGRSNAEKSSYLAVSTAMSTPITEPSKKPSAIRKSEVATDSQKSFFSQSSKTFLRTDTGARANMGAMLNQLLSLGVHTMIGIPTPICAENAPPAWAAVVDFRSAERQLEQYCAWLRRFSKCFGAECIDFRADFFDPNGRLKRELLLDGLHPTPEGHQIMVRRLSAHLKRERQG